MFQESMGFQEETCFDGEKMAVNESKEGEDQPIQKWSASCTTKLRKVN